MNKTEKTTIGCAIAFYALLAGIGIAFWVGLVALVWWAVVNVW